MLHRIILVLTLLVAVGCTGDDTVIRETFCPTLERVLMEDETCPDPPPAVTPPTPPTPPEPGADSGECNLNATGKATFNGSSGDDVICGDGDNNVINALGGEDVVRAGGGNDTVDGGEGNDELYGEAGDDTLSGGEDEDIIDGGPGNDKLIGNEGRDEFKGGAGSDTVIYTGMENEVVSGGTAIPDFEINLANGFSVDEYGDQDEYDSIENVTITGSGAYKIVGNSAANRIDGGTGAVDGNDLDGGDGVDTLIVGTAATLGDTWNSNFENLEARAGVTISLDLTGDTKNNVIKGGNAGGTLDGGGGNDRLYAGSGGSTTVLSTLNGGQGDDTLVGGAGIDNLIGGPGRDTLTGNEGNDCFEFLVEYPVVTDRVTDFGEGDFVAVSGTPSDDLEQSEGDLTVEAKSGNIVVVETYDHDDDPSTTARTTNRATVATVGRALADSNGAISKTACP